jgi:hypothetical protein
MLIFPERRERKKKQERCCLQTLQDATKLENGRSSDPAGEQMEASTETKTQRSEMSELSAMRDSTIGDDDIPERWERKKKARKMMPKGGPKDATKLEKGRSSDPVGGSKSSP